METTNKKYNGIKIDIKKIFNEFLIILVGTYLISFAINVFLLPNKLSTGGASGIGTIFYYIANLPLGVTVMLINVPLFVFSLVKLGIKFSAKSIFTTTLLSVLLSAFDYTSLIEVLDTDLFISAIFGGLVLGIGLSLLFRVGASSGGSDLLAQIIYKLGKAQSLSQMLLIIDTIVILAIVIVFKNVNLGLYSIVAIFVSKKTIDIIFEGIYNTKVVTIITNSSKEIVNDIFVELERGATLTDVRGAYTDHEYTSITVIITVSQMPKLKNIIMRYDKRALMYVSNANAVFGRGFKQM